jgi:hypothetical protein
MLVVGKIMKETRDYILKVWGGGGKTWVTIDHSAAIMYYPSLVFVYKRTGIR